MRTLSCYNAWTSDKAYWVNFGGLDFAGLPALRSRDAAGMACQPALGVRCAGFVEGREGVDTTRASRFTDVL
jgi:hypothetical protein